MSQIRISLDKNKFDSVNLYFQDESRFGLKTHVGRCLTAKGVKPIVKYKHAFKNTYLYGSFSPIDGNYFIYEIEGTSSEIFLKYLQELSKHRPNELMIVVIDNAGFHSLQQFSLDIPDNIKLIRIPPYSPELNPSEKIWAYIKQYFKNKMFDSLSELKEWLTEFINKKLNSNIVKSITHDSKYLDIFNANIII
ncbi:IS630 family transposase [Carboxylicivirga marina]|uniref:IS630 family transposase n=1 Tax=Carboxylicivirga marina TaxID=2800988 RepID=UPI002596E72A|nr:IS630 family transposase [uncultured Carboxylicivirga sp.]